MSKQNLTRDSEFTVGEEKLLNYILALLCFALFMYGLIDAVRRNFVHVDYQSFFFALALWPAILFFKKAKSNRVFIRINKTGIYHDGQKVTDWNDFLKAYLAQQEKKNVINIQDRFQLVVEFRKKGDPKQGLRKKIPLGNTQNKSEEEVLQAVTFFHKQYKKDNGLAL